MSGSGELAWFREQFWRSILRPRDFAATLAREHYGIAGVLVALAAGAGLSLGVDLLVLAAKGLAATDHVARLGTDAFLLATRLVVSAAVVAWLTIGALRALRRTRLTLDQLFTALTFALGALVFAPVPGLVVAVAASPATLLAGGVIVLALVLRGLAGLALNLRALLPPAFAALAFVLVVVLGSLVLGDQVSRMRFLTYEVVPGLVTELAVSPATGTRHEMLDFALVLPPEWRNATTGTPGEAGRFESPAATVVVARAGASPVDTADAYANNVARQQRMGLADTWEERSATRIDGLVAVDDRYGGTSDGRTIVVRQFTVMRGARGLALVYRAVDPADRGAALAEAAAIARTWTFR